MERKFTAKTPPNKRRTRAKVRKNAKVKPKMRQEMKSQIVFGKIHLQSTKMQ